MISGGRSKLGGLGFGGGGGACGLSDVAAALSAGVGFASPGAGFGRSGAPGDRRLGGGLHAERGEQRLQFVADVIEVIAPGRGRSCG